MATDVLPVRQRHSPGAPGMIAFAAAVCLIFAFCTFTAFPGWAAVPDTLSFPASELVKNSDGYYSVQAVVPSFDRVSVSWNSDRSPVLSLRVWDDSAGAWGDWQDIQENGQTYIQRVGGIFDLDFFSAHSRELTLEIRAQSNQEAGLLDITLDFTTDPRDSTSTAVMIVVMLAAGGALYLKKRR